MKQNILLFSILLTIPICSDAFFWIKQDGGAIARTSEEYPPLTCPEDHLVTGIKCSGSRCDNISLECNNQFLLGCVLSEGGGNDGSNEKNCFNTSFSHWKSNISEESNNNTKFCDITEMQGTVFGTAMHGVMTGISCSGRYCDNISLKCSAIDYIINFNHCIWSEWVSEENGGTLLFQEGYYAYGIECKGSFCDNKKFYLCPLTK